MQKINFGSASLLRPLMWFDRTTLYVMGSWNPKDNQIPAQNSTQNLYSGVGVQVLFLFNH